MPGDRTDTELVLAVRTGDRDAFGTLFERWFDRVYDVARNIVRNPETAADVAQDSFIAAWERIDRLDNPDAFGGWLLRIARNRALDRLEREGRSRPQEHDVVTGLHDRGARDLTGSGRTLEPEEISAAHDRDGLVRAAAVALGERDASVLDLHLRHGLTPAEIADELGITANNAHQLLFRMRKKLGDAIGAFVLFRRGRPACPELAGLLGADSEFDMATFELVEHHRRRCAECTDRRMALVSPEQLFSAAPILTVPALLRSRVIEQLQAAGVPTPAATPPGTIEGSIDGSIDGHVDPDAPTTAADAAAPAAAGRPPAEPDPPSDSDVVEPLPAPRPDRSWRRRALPVLGAAAVVILLLVLAVRPRNEATADPSSALGAPAVTTSDSSTPSSSPPDTDAIEPRVGAPPSTLPDGLTGAATTVEPAADVAPTTAAPLAPTPAAPTAPPPPPATSMPPSPTAPPSAPPTAPPTTSPPPTAPPTTSPPTAAPTTTTPPAPPPPDIVRLVTRALPPGTLLCSSGAPYEFDWATTNATSATLAIGPTSRAVPVTGPYLACGSSGQPVTLTALGPGGTDSASTVIP